MIRMVMGEQQKIRVTKRPLSPQHLIQHRLRNGAEGVLATVVQAVDQKSNAVNFQQNTRVGDQCGVRHKRSPFNGVTAREIARNVQLTFMFFKGILELLCAGTID